MSQSIFSIAQRIFLLFAAAAWPCVGVGEGLPKFNDYPVPEVYKGPNAELKEETNSEYFSEILRSAISREVDFAGHYIVYHYSCGGGCISGGLLDAKTGKIAADFPDNYIGGDQPESFMSNYKPESRLMVITGRSAYKDTGVNTNYYEFSEGEFRLLASRPRTK